MIKFRSFIFQYGPPYLLVAEKGAHRFLGGILVLLGTLALAFSLGSLLGYYRETFRILCWRLPYIKVILGFSVSGMSERISILNSSQYRSAIRIVKASTN